jgi:hypothetical protein
MNTQDEKPLTRHLLYHMAHREQLAEKAHKWRAENPGVWNAHTLASRHKKWDEYLAKNNERNRKLRADMKAKAIAAAVSVASLPTLTGTLPRTSVLWAGQPSTCRTFRAPGS